MRKQKAKQRTSWTRKYVPERIVLQDQLEAKGRQIDDLDFSERFLDDLKSEDVQTYLEKRRDSEVLNEYYKDPEKYDKLAEQYRFNRDVERYNQERQNKKDSWNRVSEKT